MSESFLELMPKAWEVVDREACKAEFDDVKQFDMKELFKKGETHEEFYDRMRERDDDEQWFPERISINSLEAPLDELKCDETTYHTNEDE